MKIKTKTIYILDDQYGLEIYNSLNELILIEKNINSKFFNIKFEFPIKTNILNPLDYINEIIKKEPDFVLLDHWFQNGINANPLGIRFLYLLNEKLKELNKTKQDFKTRFISISDDGKRLKEGDTLYKDYINKDDFIITKNSKDILNMLKKYI